MLEGEGGDASRVVGCDLCCLGRICCFGSWVWMGFTIFLLSVDDMVQFTILLLKWREGEKWEEEREMDGRVVERGQIFSRVFGF